MIRLNPEKEGSMKHPGKEGEGKHGDEDGDGDGRRNGRKAT